MKLYVTALALALVSYNALSEVGAIPSLSARADEIARVVETMTPEAMEKMKAAARAGDKYAIEVLKFSKEKAPGMIENAKSKFRQSFELIKKAKENGEKFAASRKAEGDKAPVGTENEHKSLY